MGDEIAVRAAVDHHELLSRDAEGMQDPGQLDILAGSTIQKTDHPQGARAEPALLLGRRERVGADGLRGLVAHHRRTLNDHGPVEARAFDRLVVAVADLDVGDFDDVVVLQDVAADRLAVHRGAVGAAEVLQDVVVADRADTGVGAADPWDGQAQVALREAADGEGGLVEETVLDDFAVSTDNQFWHGLSVRIAG